MKKPVLFLACTALVAQSSYSATPSPTGATGVLGTSLQLKCDEQKTLTLTTSSSLNNLSNAKDTLTISSNTSAEASVFTRSQEERQIAEDHRVTDQSLELATHVVSIVVIGTAINALATAAVESALLNSTKYPAFYEKILEVLGKYKPGYKVNLGQILSKEEMTFLGLAPLSLTAAYYVNKSIYKSYLEAKANQYKEKLCNGDYTVITNDHWSK